jgi:hypothetical protein
MQFIRVFLARKKELFKVADVSHYNVPLYPEQAVKHFFP